MKLGKFLIAGVLIPALISPAIAVSAVRPSVKPIEASPANQDRSLVVRQGTRAAADVENENSLIGLPLVWLIAGLVAVVVTAVVIDEIVDDEPASPGS